MRVERTLNAGGALTLSAPYMPSRRRFVVLDFFASLTPSFTLSGIMNSCR